MRETHVPVSPGEEETPATWVISVRGGCWRANQHRTLVVVWFARFVIRQADGQTEAVMVYY